MSLGRPLGADVGNLADLVFPETILVDVPADPFQTDRRIKPDRRHCR